MREIITLLRQVNRKLADILAALNLIAKRLEPPPPQVPTSIRWTVGQPVKED